MLDAVLHVVERLLREDLVFGRGHRVGHLARILHRDLFVPPLLAHAFLAFEGVETRDVEDHGRQRHREALVLRVLRDGHVRREREGCARPVLRVGDRRVGLRREDVVEVGRRIFAVTAGREVYRCREGRPGVGLGILGVCPLDAEVALLDIVRFAFFARLDVRVLHVETAAVLVTFDVARCGRCLPRTERVEPAAHGQVGVVAQREIVTHVAQEEPLGVFLAIGGHQQTRFWPHVDREETLGDAEKVDRHVLHDEVSRPRDDFLARDDLGFGHRQVEVRVVGLVAGRVFAVFDVDRVVGHLLHAPADQPAVALLRCHALDLGLLRGEVVGDRIHRVRCVALGEFGLGDDRFAFERIGLAVCIDHLVVHVDLHVVGLEVAVLIGDVALVVDIDHLVAHVVDQRILVLARDRVVEERPRFLGLFLFHRVAGDGVRSAAFERVAFLRDERIELLLRQGFECGAAACLFPGGACLLAAVAAALGRSFRHFGRGFGMDPEGIGQALAEAVFGCRGKHSPGYGRAEHQLGEEEECRRRKQIFYPDSIQNPNNFSYLCRHVGKNAWIGASMHSRRVF